MKESIVTGPLFSPDSDEDDVDMDNDKSRTTNAENIAPVPQQNTTAGEVVLFCRMFPLPRSASNIRNDTETDNNDGTSHPEGITLAPPQNTGAGTVALFHRNLESPLFKLGSKRPAEEMEEERNQHEERQNQMRVNVRAFRLFQYNLYGDIPKFRNPPPPPPFRFKEVNRILNQQLHSQQALLMTQSETVQDAHHTVLGFAKTKEEMGKHRMDLQAQQELLMTQNKTIHDTQQMMLEFKKTAEEGRMELQAQQELLMTQSKMFHDAQQMMLEFKKTTEEMAKDRVELLKIIEGLKANQVVQEAEMTCLKVYHLFMMKRHSIYVLGAEGARISGRTSKG